MKTEATSIVNKQKGHLRLTSATGNEHSINIESRLGRGQRLEGLCLHEAILGVWYAAIGEKKPRPVLRKPGGRHHALYSLPRTSA